MLKKPKFVSILDVLLNGVFGKWITATWGLSHSMITIRTIWKATVIAIVGLGLSESYKTHDISLLFAFKDYSPLVVFGAAFALFLKVDRDEYADKFRTLDRKFDELTKEIPDRFELLSVS